MFYQVLVAAAVGPLSSRRAVRTIFRRTKRIDRLVEHCVGLFEVIPKSLGDLFCGERGFPRRSDTFHYPPLPPGRESRRSSRRKIRRRFLGWFRRSLRGEFSPRNREPAPWVPAARPTSPAIPFLGFSSEEHIQTPLQSQTWGIEDTMGEPPLRAFMVSTKLILRGSDVEEENGDKSRN